MTHIIYLLIFVLHGSDGNNHAVAADAFESPADCIAALQAVQAANKDVVQAVCLRRQLVGTST